MQPTDTYMVAQKVSPYRIRSELTNRIKKSANEAGFYRQIKMKM